MILQKKVGNHSLPWINRVREKNGNDLQAAKNVRQNESEKKSEILTLSFSDMLLAQHRKRNTTFPDCT